MNVRGLNINARVRHPVLARSLAVLCIGLFVLLVSAPAQNPPPLNCTIAAGVPPTVRAEGLTELVGDIVLNCTGGGSPLPPGSPLPTVDITVLLNTNITSRLIRDDLTEALLLIDEPGVENQHLSGVTPRNTAGCAPSADCPNVFLARRNGPNGVVWAGIPVNPPTNDTKRIFRITNVRGNAALLTDAAPTAENPPQIVAQIKVTSPDPVFIIEPLELFWRAPVLPTFNFSVQDRVSISSSTGHTGPVATFRFREGFASAFKRANCAVSPSNPNPGREDLFGSVCRSNLLWPYVTSEGGFDTGLAIANTSVDPFGPTPSHPAYSRLTEVGISRGGTELRARFDNIPSGIRLFVRATNLGATPQSHAQLLIAPDSQNFAPVQPNGFTSLQTICPDYQTTRTCTAAWEILAASPDTIETFDFITDGIWTPGATVPQTTVTTITPSVGPSAAAWDLKSPLTAVPGFQGYLLAQVDFSFAHGFAFIHDISVQRLAHGYLALVLDGAETDRAAFEVRRESLGNLRDETSIDGARGSGRLVLLGEDRQQTASRRFELTSEGYLPKTVRLGAAGSTRLSNFTITVQSAQGSGGPWLSVEQIGEATPITLVVRANPQGLQPGTYAGSVTVQPMTPPGVAPTAIPFELVVPPPGPRVRTFGVTSAGSYAHSVVAPGEAVVVFGEGFGPGDLAGLVLSNGVVATEIGETRILFDGDPAPMIYSVANQASCFVPFSVEGKTFVEMTVEYKGVASPRVRLAVSPAKPALLTADQSGGGVGAILNQDNSFNVQKAARAGEIVQVFGIGGGQTTPPSVGGRLQTGAAAYNRRIRAFVDGVEVTPIYAGPAPNLVEGVFQVNLRLPQNARRGRLPLSIFFGDDLRTQPGVTVWVE